MNPTSPGRQTVEERVDDPSPGSTGRPGTVSVVVPCHNYGRFLELCVRSVLGQRGVTFDVVIIDDCSTDDTAEICDRLAAEDARVQVIRHATRHGHVATFNEGLANASGDYLVLLSADDALVPGALERAAHFLDDESSVGLIYGHPVFFAGEPLPPARTGHGSRRIRPGADWIAGRCRAGTNCISSPEVMMRSDTLERVGYFRPELPITGDLELWLRIAAHADIGYLAGTDQAFYRRHPDSMYRSNRRVVADLEHRRNAFSTFFEHDGRHIPRAELHEAHFRVALAEEALWKACRAYDRGRVDNTPIGPLMYFAATTLPDSGALPHEWGLRRRIRMGERACRTLEPFDWYAIGRHVVERAQIRRWARTGDL